MIPKRDDRDEARETGPVTVETVPERADTYVNPETGQSGLTFAQLVAQVPHLYPDVELPE
jgi:hypothetical protein